MNRGVFHMRSTLQSHEPSNAEGRKKTVTCRRQRAEVDDSRLVRSPPDSRSGRVSQWSSQAQRFALRLVPCSAWEVPMVVSPSLYSRVIPHFARFQHRSFLAANQLPSNKSRWSPLGGTHLNPKCSAAALVSCLPLRVLAKNPICSKYGSTTSSSVPASSLSVAGGGSGPPGPPSEGGAVVRGGGGWGWARRRG